MTPIGGGVRISAREALSAANLLSDEDGTVAATRKAITLDNLPQGVWWWD
jgi:hypothetical protein